MNINPLFPIPRKFPFTADNAAPKTVINKILDTAIDEAGDIETVEGVAKTTRDLFHLIGQVKPTETGTQVMTHSAVLGDTFDFLELFEGGQVAVKNFSKSGGSRGKKAKRHLKGTSGVIGVVLGIMAGARILESFQLYTMSNITKLMGQIRVVGPYLAAVFPFATVFSLVEFVRAIVDIAASSLRLKELSRTIKRATDRITGKWKDPIDLDIAKRIAQELDKKQVKVLKQANKLLPKLEESGELFDKCAQVYLNKKEEFLKAKQKLKTRFTLSGLSKVISSKIALLKPKKDCLKSGQAYGAVNETFTQLKETFEYRQKQVEQWQEVKNKFEAGAVTDEDMHILDTFRNKKIEKWGIKRANTVWQKNLEKISLALSIILVAFIFATFVIGFTPLGAIPAFLFVTGAISLTITVGYFAKHLLDKHKHDTPHSRIPLKIGV